MHKPATAAKNNKTAKNLKPLLLKKKSKAAKMSKPVKPSAIENATTIMMFGITSLEKPLEAAPNIVRVWKMSQ